MNGVIFRYTLNISVANIRKFLAYIETELSYSNISSKNGVFSQYSRPKHNSCKRLILLFIIRLWNIQVKGQ